MSSFISTCSLAQGKPGEGALYSLLISSSFKLLPLPRPSTPRAGCEDRQSERRAKSGLRVSGNMVAGEEGQEEGKAAK